MNAKRIPASLHRPCKTPRALSQRISVAQTLSTTLRQTPVTLPKVPWLAERGADEAKK